MALVKVVGTGEKRVEALRIADAFRARVVDATTESFVFEMTGATDKLDAFIELMRAARAWPRCPAPASPRSRAAPRRRISDDQHRPITDTNGEPPCAFTTTATPT